MRSTGTGWRAALGGTAASHGRAASADDARPLATRRSGIRPGSCPRPSRRGGLRRRTCPRRDRAGVSRDLWEDAASDVGGPARDARRSSSTPARRLRTPIWTAAIEERAHAYIWALGRETIPIRAAASSIRSSAGFLALSRRAARGAAGPSGVAPRPGRASARVPRVRADLDRRASRRGAARVQGPPVVAAPMGHGDVGERDRDVDVRRRRRPAGTALHAGTRLMRREPSERRQDGLRQLLVRLLVEHAPRHLGHTIATSLAQSATWRRRLRASSSGLRSGRMEPRE